MLSDLRYSARALARTPGLTIVLLLSIAIGVGGNAMVYGFMRGSLNRAATLVNTKGLVSIFQHAPEGGFMPLSAAQFESVAAQSSIFETVGAVREDHDDVAFGGVSALAVVGSMTEGLLPALGFARTRVSPGQLIVSHRMWVDVFGAPKNFS